MTPPAKPSEPSANMNVSPRMHEWKSVITLCDQPGRPKAVFLEEAESALAAAHDSRDKALETAEEFRLERDAALAAVKHEAGLLEAIRGQGISMHNMMRREEESKAHVASLEAEVARLKADNGQLKMQCEAANAEIRRLCCPDCAPEPARPSHDKAHCPAVVHKGEYDRDTCYEDHDKNRGR